MAANTSVSRSLKSLLDDEDSPFEGLVAPASTPQNAGQTVQIAELQSGGAQIARAIAGDSLADDLSKIQIRDSVGIGGVSPTEIQRRLMNVFMSDEDRKTYEDALQVDPSRAVSRSEPQAGPISASDAVEALSRAIHLPERPGESFGAEGALMPQGISVPQGLLARMGLMSSLGLVAPRTDGPVAAGQHSQQAPASEGQSASSKNSPGAAQSGPQQAPSAGSAGPQSAGANTQSFAPIHSHFDSGSTFKPLNANSGPVGQALWKSKGSPFAVIFRGIGNLLLGIFGFGKSGQAPHRRGIK